MFTASEFKEILKKATSVQMKHSKDKRKLKARTKKYLYTYVCEPKEAESLWSKIKIPKQEIRKTTSE